MRRIPFWILPGLPLDQGFQLATGGRLIHGSYWLKFRKTKPSLSLAFLTILSKYRLFLWGRGRHQFICSLEIFLWDNKELKRTPKHQVCGCQGLKSAPRPRNWRKQALCVWALSPSPWRTTGQVQEESTAVKSSMVRMDYTEAKRGDFSWEQSIPTQTAKLLCRFIFQPPALCSFFTET